MLEHYLATPMQPVELFSLQGFPSSSPSLDRLKEKNKNRNNNKDKSNVGTAKARAKQYLELWDNIWERAQTSASR